MKKIIATLIVIFIIGCSKDGTNSENVIDYLKVTIDKYDYNFTESSNFTNSSNINNGNVIIQLLDNNVIKRIGSPISASASSGLGSYGFTEKIYDTIIKNNNKITIYKKIIPFGGTTSIVPDKKEFYLNNDGKINYKIKYNQDYYNGDNDTIYFNYFNNKIIQTYSKNYGYKTKESDFYYNTNENLDSIVTKFYQYDNTSNQMVLVPTREVETFEQYDNAINPFKTLTIFDDMFKRSLSKNNYSVHKITQYNPFAIKYQKNITLHYDAMGNLIYKN